MIPHIVGDAPRHMSIAFMWIIPFCFVLFACAYVDVQNRRIPNALSLSLIFAGPLFHLIFAGLHGLVSSLIGMAIGFFLFLLLYLLGMMGAGDVKMMAGVGAVMGSDLIFPTIVFTIVCGGVLAIMYSVAAIYNDSKTQSKLVLKLQHKTSLPYGLAITAGTIITLILSSSL